MPTINSPDGVYVGVNSEHQLLTYSTIETESRHVNENEKEAFCVLVDVTTATTDDDFFYLKNTSVKNLMVERVEGWCDDANQEISVLIGGSDAGTDAGDALTPGNMNAGGTVANCDCTQDATDLAITGGHGVALLKFPTTALERAVFEFPEGIVLPENARLHMSASLAGLINLSVYFFYHG